MGIGYFIYIGHTGTVVLPWGGGGGGELPPGEKSMGDYLKYKNQYHFQYDTTKVYQFLRLFTIIKLLILIQSFYFTHILHSSESLVYNRFYIVYDITTII